MVPISFSGRNSEHFYRIAKFSDRWLPFNLAMIFLVDEMYRNVGQALRHISRKAYTLADVRQEPHAVRVGTVGAAGGGVPAKPLPTLPVGESRESPKGLEKA